MTFFGVVIVAFAIGVTFRHYFAKKSFDEGYALVLDHARAAILFEQRWPHEPAESPDETIRRLQREHAEER